MTGSTGTASRTAPLARRPAPARRRLAGAAGQAGRVQRQVREVQAETWRDQTAFTAQGAHKDMPSQEVTASTQQETGVC